ncbi:hypothetical protein [Anabaena sp. 4-3]|uniref:hypothetical protein n=1 Tax=Anabaena sp. 4-3 TaxID=1811979 RepID=UPI000A94F67B|nr:hypothetical protein [Anabaena sp. 4-3]
MQIFQWIKRMLSRIFQGKTEPIQTLKITMLGSSGVGKSSLLAAIYDQFDQVIGKTNLQIKPTDDATRVIMDARLQELKSLVGNTIKVTGGVKGGGSPRSFLFDLGKTGRSPSLRLQFQDYPGGYIESHATPENIKTVENFIRESAAVLIAIDTPMMMEMKGKWHDRFNQPTRIINLFKQAYENLDTPRLVILAPVKCEKYIQNDKDANELLANIRDKYGTLLDYFGSDELLLKVAVVVTPVQTVGSVFFSRVEMQDDEPCFYFVKRDPDSFYQPKDSEQPLCYLLRFILRLHLEKRRIPIINSILNIFGKDVAFKEAVLDFTGNCKNTGGFAVIQGANLLRIDSK